MNSRLAVSIAMFCSLVVLTSGCEHVDPRVAAARQRLLLTADPGATMSFEQVRKQLKDEAVPVSEVPVVLKGRVDAGESVSPWQTGLAAFVLTDATGHDDDEAHNPHTCPFCSRNITDYMAKVSFRENGSVIDIDSRELFGVTDRQRVIIRGTASLDDDGLLKVDATGLFISPR
ncbi:MAG: hypothetical protein R3C49_15500 [Planctomycetaceae bacterium]